MSNWNWVKINKEELRHGVWYWCKCPTLGVKYVNWGGNKFDFGCSVSSKKFKPTHYIAN